MLCNVTAKPSRNIDYPDSIYVSWPWNENPDSPDGNLYLDILEWCTEHFGVPGVAYAEEARWNEALIVGSLTFHRKEDAMLFLLKWG